MPHTPSGLRCWIGGGVMGARLIDPMVRFQAKVEHVGDCWVWTAADDGQGYGRFGLKGRMVSAHRWMYEQTVGEIPDGLELDHLCRNPSCVNPAHLEAVVHQENMRRSEPANRTHCPAGHSYALRGGKRAGKRYCRECNRLRMARVRATDGAHNEGAGDE